MATVRETLQSLPGVAKVDVDFPSKTAHAVLESDAESFDSEAAVEALSEAGFPKSTVKKSAG